MKNKLGIEIHCENCKQCTDNGNGCGIMEDDNQSVFGTHRCVFSPSTEAYETRIKELQEQLTKQEGKQNE